MYVVCDCKFSGVLGGSSIVVVPISISNRDNGVIVNISVRMAGTFLLRSGAIEVDA